MSTTQIARPFLKWAGGKTQLLPILDKYLPADFKLQHSITYIEPFIGGGAMLFKLLQTYPNIQKAVINDINLNLIKTYRTIRNNSVELINAITQITHKYLSLGSESDRKDFFLDIRDKFNTQDGTDIEKSSWMLFLNRTCFNGLYRENSRGCFNVPFGKYPNPSFIAPQLISSTSELLQRVTILHGDFTQIREHVAGYTFIYFDPPYRPLDATSNFNSYVREKFDDNEQIRLRNFAQEMWAKGCHVLLSNSDGQSRNPENKFLNNLYEGFIIERVYASRAINSKATKRGKLTELLIRNYPATQAD